jgi:hypothetical protein
VLEGVYEFLVEGRMKKVLCEAVRAAPKGGRECEREVAAAWPMLIAQPKSELLQLLRDPEFIISSVILPTIFFAFFGLPVVDERTAGTGAGYYLLASFGAYGVIGREDIRRFG